MTPYELADWLEEAYKLWQAEDCMPQAANMLRQQADRIAELEKENDDLKHDLDEYIRNANLMANEAVTNLLYTTPQTKSCKDCGEINPAEIHTCSPQTNAEPLAWMGMRRDGETRVSVEKLDADDIPLYTTPQTKPLDEVLMYNKGFNDALRKLVTMTTPQTKPLTDEEIKEIASKTDLESGVAQWKYDFARAIEERILGK